MPDPKATPSPATAREFATTSWSLVLRAGRRDGAASAEALEKLCRANWFPLYAFARREGCGPEEAQDLTQEFFSRLLAKNYLQTADPRRSALPIAGNLPAFSRDGTLLLSVAWNGHARLLRTPAP